MSKAAKDRKATNPRSSNVFKQETKIEVNYEDEAMETSGFNDDNEVVDYAGRYLKCCIYCNGCSQRRWQRGQYSITVTVKYIMALWQLMHTRMYGYTKCIYFVSNRRYPREYRGRCSGKC